MPRDGSGNFTLEAGNPVQPSTTIATNWLNPSFDDFAAAFTDSLSRSGLGGMLVPFRNVDGIQAAPGITWNNELGSGFFRVDTGDFRASVLGQAVARFRDDSINPPGSQNPFQVFDGLVFANVLTVSFQGQLTMGDGTALLPTYTFANSPASGMWSSAPNVLDWTINGINHMSLDADALTLEAPIELIQTLPAVDTVRDGALAYDGGSGNLVMQRGAAWNVIPSSVPSDNILTEDAVVKDGDFPAIVGVFNYIDTRLDIVTVTLPIGEVGARWGYIDYFREFPSNNCVVVPNGADLIEGLNEDYLMDLQGVSGVLRFTTDRGWVDTGGMA